MPEINRVMTRGGDKGETSLVDGSRVAKCSLRVRAYGTVDELNSCLGMVRCEDLPEGLLEAWLGGTSAAEMLLYGVLRYQRYRGSASDQ